MIYTKELYECQEELIKSLEDKIKLQTERIEYLENRIAEMIKDRQQINKYTNMKGRN